MPMSNAAFASRPYLAERAGRFGQLGVPSGVHPTLHESLGRPAWYTAGTSMAESRQPMPRIISVADDLRMIENIVDRLGADGFIDHIVRTRMRLCGRAGLLAVQYAGSLRAGMDFLTGHIGETHPYFTIERDAEPGFILYRVRPTVALGRAWPALGAVIALFMHQLVAQSAVQGTAGVRVYLDADLPGDMDLHQSWFSAPVRSIRQASGIAIPADVADRPNELSDPGLWELACHRLEEEIRLLDTSPESCRIRGLVQRVLAAEHRIPTIRQAAAGLRLSERTLIRRLAMAGTSFRALADDERRLHALSLIIDPGLDIQEVSDRLGFPDRSVFGRKFRSWTGETPSAYRASRTRAGRALATAISNPRPAATG